MTQPLLLVVGSITLVLVFFLMRSTLGVLSDFLQTRANRRRLEANEKQANLALGARLQKTYTDLSLARRQAIWREVMVIKVVQESQDVRSFYMVDPEHDPLPAAIAGQHILVERTNAKTFRCYTLSDDSTAGHWRISVKKNSEHPDSVSRWLHEEIGVGSTLRVRGPSGSFYFQTEEDRKVVLASAGIGLTPMLPMLITSVRQRVPAIHCFAQFRDVAHMPFADSLVNLANKFPQIDMNIWISQFPKGVKRSSGSLFREGKFRASDLVRHPHALDLTDYYLCGPEAWQEQMCEDLIAAGVDKNCIRYELFQTSEKPRPAATESKSVTHKVHFQQSGYVAPFDTDISSLLGCASKNNVAIDSGCRMGACGSCAVKLLGGKVRYTRDPQVALQSNVILPCVCVPETDVILDA